MKTTIIENKGARYLSEFEEFKHDLPDNVFFNKITTGSGMTTIAVANDVKYVLCMPFKNLVKNKLEWCARNNVEAIGVFAESEGGATLDQIKSFKGNKILTTWDSLKKVMQGLGDDIKEWKLLIDEAHQLVHSGCFRTDAVEQVLDNYTKFKSFIFGTATPIKDEYQLPALQNLDKVEIKWDNLDIVNVHYTKYEKQIDKSVAVLAVKYLKGELPGNAHIFINSVKSITNILRHVKKSGELTDSNFKIVCADTDRNKEIISKSLGKAHAPASINSEVTKINFYTSTAFEGCDIYDEDGHTYIVSDGSKDHTKIDILTSLPQIIARVRNARVKNFVELWFTPNKYYSHTTEEQFKETVLKELERANKVVAAYNIVPEEAKAIMRNGSEDDAYLRVINDTLKVNDTAWYSEMNSFVTLHKTYYVNKDAKMSAMNIKLNTIDYKYQPVDVIDIKGLNKVKIGKKPSFKDLCNEYFEAAESIGENDFIKINLKMDDIATVEPLIKEAYDVLGKDKMIALELIRKDIQRELDAITTLKSNDWKVSRLLDYRVGEWKSLKDLKEEIQAVYDKLGIKKTAKATDVNQWFITDKQAKRIDGQRKDGIAIVAPKINKIN